MFKRTESLRKKIIASCVIGLGILTIGTCAVETHRNFNRNKVRYILAKSKVQELAEYDSLEGTSSNEWMSVYKQIGKHYEIGNPQKLSLKEAEIYLEKFGYFWDGREYAKK